MPFFSVKKTREGPDQEEQKEEIHLPDEVSTKIMMKLDGRSLHTARQVCPEWKTFIESQVLGTVEGRGQMERTLQHQWREATPARSVVTIGGLVNPRVLAITDKLAVIRSGPLSGKICVVLAVIRSGPLSRKICVVNTIDGVEVPGLSYIAAHIYGALITSDVLLLAKRVVGGFEVLAWNFHTMEEIFKEKFPFDRVVFDRHNQQVMVGRNSRLEITGTTVTENIQTPLPGDLDLVRFSHPLYLTAGGGVTTLWKLDGTGFTRVGDLGAIIGLFSVFCPARDLLVNYSTLQGRMRLRFFSTQTCQLTKDRDLTLPTDITSISPPKVSANQLVVKAWQPGDHQYVLLVYELDSLLSQSVAQQIAPRMFEIGQQGFDISEIYLDKTSVSAGLQGTDTVKYISLDFWNAEN